MGFSDSPLSDLKVLDLTRVMAGPYGTRLLCDLGADVVKLEPPEGDITRSWGEQRHGLSGFYTQQNAGKRNVCIDLKKGMEDVLDSPTLKARPPFARVDDGAGGERRVVEAPYEFSKATSGVRGSAPRRGEHNARVLCDWLAMKPDEIKGLEKSGTLLAEETP